MARGRKKKESDITVQDDSEKMIDNGVAQFPAQSIEKESSDSNIDYQSHPKFHKFKGIGQGVE